MKGGNCQRTTAEYPLQCAAKLDRGTLMGRLNGEKFADCYLNDRTGSCKIEPIRCEQSSDIQKYCFNSSEHTGAESTSSSVSSCSVNSPFGSHRRQSYLSDTSCSRERNSMPSRKGDLQEEIHQLELSAYQSTITALYASGLVSWEREAVMTNLRLMLNISTDEHLMEIRKLINSETTAYHCS